MNKKNLKKKLFEKVDENAELTEKQKLFCVFYVDSFNATQSYLKVYGGNYNSAMINGNRMLRNDKIQAELKKLKEEMRNHFEVGVEDYVDYLLKVVGAKVSDFVKFGVRGKKNFVEILDSEVVDDTAITELKTVKGDVSLKLEDKKWAWKELARIFGFDGKESQSNLPVVIGGENDLED